MPGASDTRPDSSERALRVALVTNVIPSYRVPCFRRLAEELPGRLTFFVMTRELADREYILASEDLGDLPIVTLDARRRFRRSLFDDIHWNDLAPILAADFDVVILGGWSEPTLLELWLRFQFRRARLLIWSESTEVDLARSWKKEWLKRLLLRGVAGCIVPGRRAAGYCERLGLAPSRIFTAPNATDREFFRSRADRLRPRRETLRGELGLEHTTLLFVGRLTHEFKCIGVLPEAVARLEARGLSLTLVLVGEGPDEEWCRERARELGCRDVRFTGTLDHDALCPYYAAADLLIVPSRSDPWGFVVNEAMEFGLPLVVSEAVGAGPDLVAPGGNGLVVPVGDAEALADAIESICSDEAARSRMGEVSREKIEAFTPERWAKGVVAAIESVSGGGD